LFWRRIARLHDRRDDLRALSYRLPRGSKIDQAGCAVAPNHDVVGRDITMKEPVRMHEGKCIEQRCEQAVDLDLRRGSAQVFEPAFEAVTRFIDQHHVGGAVAFEYVRDINNIRVFARGEGAPFLQEAVESPGESGPIGRAHVPARAVPVRELAREVLLDGEDASEAIVVGDVGNAEATRADH
jgi:hypothetical protein